MELEQNHRQNRRITVFACFLSLISIGLLVFGFLLVSSDKVVMLQSISNLFGKLDYTLENSSSLYEKLSSFEDIGVRSNMHFNSDTLDTKVSFDYLENKKDEKSKLRLDITLNEEDLLGTSLALEKGNAYFFIDNITPSYYHTSFKYYSFLSGLSSNDYEKALALLKESVSDYIDNQNIKKEKTTISYNGKDKRVNKLTYEITNQTILDITTTFIDALKKDKMLMNHISTYLGKTKEEFTTDLDSTLNNLKNSDTTIHYDYSVYYYGFNQIIAYELEDKNTETIFEYKVGNQEIINLYQKDSCVFSVEWKKVKEEYHYQGFIQNDNQKYSFSGTVSENVLTIILNQGNEDIKMVVTSSKEEKENNYLYQDNIIVSSLTSDKEMVLFTLDMEVEYYFNQKIDIDLTDSIDITEITEEEMLIIENNIVNHPIYQYFSCFLEMTEVSV